MLITDMLRARALLPMQREAMRILHEIFATLDIVPDPKGNIHFAFKGDVELLDRICVWGAHVEDIEIVDEDDEDGGDEELDGRDLDRLGVTEVEAQQGYPASDHLAA